MRKFLLLSFFLSVIMGIVVYNVSFALMNSTVSNNSNSFTSASQFSATPSATPTPTVTPVQLSLVINEIQPQGTAPAEWVEIYNKSNSPINLSGWNISDNSDQDNLPAVTIPALSYGVIVTSNTTVSVPSSAVKIQLIGAGSTQIGGSLSNTGDRFTLKNGLAIIDAMDYGDDHTYFIGPNNVKHH